MTLVAFLLKAFYIVGEGVRKPETDRIGLDTTEAQEQVTATSAEWIAFFLV